jgi:hypothetical protein
MASTFVGMSVVQRAQTVSAGVRVKRLRNCFAFALEDFTICIFKEDGVCVSTIAEGGEDNGKAIPFLCSRSHKERQRIKALAVRPVNHRS